MKCLREGAVEFLGRPPMITIGVAGFVGCDALTSTFCSAQRIVVSFIGVRRLEFVSRSEVAINGRHMVT